MQYGRTLTRFRIVRIIFLTSFAVAVLSTIEAYARIVILPLPGFALPLAFVVGFGSAVPYYYLRSKVNTDKDLQVLDVRLQALSQYGHDQPTAPKPPEGPPPKQQ